MRESEIQARYDQLLRYCHSFPVPEYLLRQSTDYQQGLWRTYLSLLERVPADYTGKTVLDFGCKYGQLLPLLLALGAGMAVGIDAEEEYVEAGRSVFETLFENIRILRSEEGYISLPSDSADIVIMNEVVSHINPRFLDTVWLELSRILKVGGVLFISDGNNIAHPYPRRMLADLYEKWENGPDGAVTDRGTVTRPFVVRREEIIRRRHPELSNAQIEHLAQNTSGLFGDFLESTIDQFVQTGELIRRPYRRGICPVNPSSAGAVMERGLHPALLEMALAEYGFEAHQTSSETSWGRSGMIGRLKDAVLWARSRLRDLVTPGGKRAAAQGFQIIAIKRR